MRMLALCGVLVSATHGCGHSCTDIGCSDHARLRFASPLSEPGQYLFEFLVDGSAFECTAFVPLRRDGTEPGCSRANLNREELTTRSGDAVSGNAGDAIEGVVLLGRFTQISLTVSRDGSQVSSADVALEYRSVELNGEGCGTCPIATHTVDD